MTTNHRFPVVEMQLAMRPVDELGTVITGHVAKGKMSSQYAQAARYLSFHTGNLHFAASIQGT